MYSVPFVSATYVRRICGVSSTLFSYLRLISDVCVAYLAYQRRIIICYECATYVSLLWRMCDILWRSKRILMLLYKCFVFPKSWIRCFSPGSGCRAGLFQGYAWCSLCLCSCRLTTRMGGLEMSPPHTHARVRTYSYYVCIDLFFS